VKPAAAFPQQLGIVTEATGSKNTKPTINQVLMKKNSAKA
jgi:hypothetical protein